MLAVKRLWTDIVAPTLAVLAFVALIVLGNWATGDAHAVAADATDRPEVLWPLPNMSGRVSLVIQAPRRAWGIRIFAREVDPQLRGVRIYERGTCRAHPFSTCVRVVHRDLGPGVYAQTEDVPERNLRRVVVNDYYTESDFASRYAVICHEFGHVLGMQHHKMLGVDGRTPNVIHLSHPELRALREAYPR